MKKVKILNSELYTVDGMTYPFDENSGQPSFLTITLKFDTKKEMKKEYKKLGLIAKYLYVLGEIK